MNRSWPAPFGEKNVRLLATIDDPATLFETNRRFHTGARLRRFPPARTRIAPVESRTPWWIRGNDDDSDPPPPEAA